MDAERRCGRFEPGVVLEPHLQRAIELGVGRAQRGVAGEQELVELGRRGGRYGLATLCVGVGQGEAAIIERVEA